MNLRIVFFALIVAFVFTACGDNSNPSNHQSKTYTVTFDVDNGNEPTTQTVTEGGTVTKPADPSKAYSPVGLYTGTPPTACTFMEWQKSDGSAWNFNTDTVTADITLTAKWITPSSIDITNETGNNIVEKAVSYVNTNGGSEYTLVLGESVSGVAPQTLDQDDTTLTITSDGTIERKISLGPNGRLFTVGGSSSSPRSAKLVIDGHITLEGKADNNAPLIYILYSGCLDLKGYAKITGNTFIGNGNIEGGGIFSYGGISEGAEVNIIMSGNAEISGNSVNSTTWACGGGITVGPYTTLTMNENATIKNNISSYAGGGVQILMGTFIMNGGEISYNTATNSSGGVYMDFDAIFMITSEQVKAGIHNNTAQIWPQVFQEYGTFTVGGEPAESF